MTRLLRSPFPIAPAAPAILQHDLFGGPPEAVKAPGDSAPPTPAMRRWCEIGGTDAARETAFGDESHGVTAAAGERHGSRPGQLARPGHSNGERKALGGPDRKLAILDRTLRTQAPMAAALHCTPEAALHSTPEATSCGRAPGHQAAKGTSATDRSERSGARKRPIIIRRRRVQARPAAPVTVDVRKASTGMIEDMAQVSAEALPMSSPAQAQPEWSCATTWLRSAEASGEGSMQQVTAAASYMFVAAMLAFTFVI